MKHSNFFVLDLLQQKFVQMICIFQCIFPENLSSIEQESDDLPIPEAFSRQATSQPTKTYNDPAKNMKRLVNQKLSDFNIKGALQTLSGNSSFVKPNEESLNTLQQKHPLSPRWSQTIPIPRWWHLTNLLQHSPNTCCNLFLPTWFRGRRRHHTATTFERLHLHHSRRCQHFSPHQLNRTSQLPSKWSSGNWPQGFPLWRPTPWALQKQRRPQTHYHAPTNVLSLKSAWDPSSQGSVSLSCRHPLGVLSCSPRTTRPVTSWTNLSMTKFSSNLMLKMPSTEYAEIPFSKKLKNTSQKSTPSYGTVFLQKHPSFTETSTTGV